MTKEYQPTPVVDIAMYGGCAYCPLLSFTNGIDKIQVVHQSISGTVIFLVGNTNNYKVLEHIPERLLQTVCSFLTYHENNQISKLGKTYE